jgi:hypothetical protein
MLTKAIATTDFSDRMDMWSELSKDIDPLGYCLLIGAGKSPS